MTINYLLLKIKVLCAIYLIINYRLVLLLILERFAMNDVQLLLIFQHAFQMILSRPKMIKNDIIMKIKITINGTLASIEAVFNTSNARSPPTSINENGNKHNANAQNKRLARNGLPTTFLRCCR